MRVAVIGLGVIAPYFLRAIAADPDLTLTAVCDLDTAKLAGFGDVVTFTDHHDLLASGLADAVVVTLPNDLHACVVADALRAGLHVCCEKPLTIGSAEAAGLTRLAEEVDRTLMTAFHRRYNHNLRELIDRLPERAQIQSVSACYHERIEEHTGPEQWHLDRERCGGGCVIDNGPNALDALQTLLGPLTLADATLGDVRGGVEFCARLELHTDDGVPVTVDLDWALQRGEVKDITVHLKDGSTLVADMLAGYPGFKSSLDHEYAGIMHEFGAAVAARPYRDAGPAVVALVEDAYRIGRSKERRLRMCSKAPVTARLTKLLFHRRTDRGMTLSPWASRCVPAGAMHEIVTTTDHGDQSAGARIDAVGFLGFACFEEATVLERGDEVWAAGKRIGRILGFDECHAPNHYNVVVATDRLLTAEDLDLRPGDRLELREIPCQLPSPS